VKSDKEGASPAHRLRHTFRTTLAQLVAIPIKRACATPWAATFQVATSGRHWWSCSGPSRTPWLALPEDCGVGMHQDERGYPIVPHEVATGDDCDGCLIVVEHGDVADLKCNSCGAVVDTVPIDRVGVRLIELGSDEICSEWCPHCGSLNTFPGFSAIEAFICRECGEGVDLEPPVP